MAKGRGAAAVVSFVVVSVVVVAGAAVLFPSVVEVLLVGAAEASSP